MLQHITLGRIELALDDLLSKRKAALQSFPYGVFITPELIELQASIGALPAATKSRPFAGDLATLDRLHDGHGGACWYLVEAYLRSPDTTPAQRAALESIRSVLGPLDDTTASYDAEAKIAKGRQAKLADIEGALKDIPLAGGKTMYDWAKSYIDAGVQIGMTLSARADAKDREAANLLRSEAVGLLNEARRQLRRAQKKNANLTADLEDLVFAWFDDLEKVSAAEAAEAKKAEAKKAAEARKDPEAKMAAEVVAPEASPPPAAGTPGDPPAGTPGDPPAGAPGDPPAGDPPAGA